MSDLIDDTEHVEIQSFHIYGSAHAVNFHHIDTRDEINSLFDEITHDARNPSIIYAEVRGILSEAGYNLPSYDNFDHSGEKVFSLMMDEGDFPEYFYFAHTVVYEDNGSEILAEVLTQEELEELFDIDE